MKFPRTVYAIQHIPTGRIYVGSSTKLEDRLKAHIGALRNGKHPNVMMQEDFNQYGEDYEYFILDEIDTYENRSVEYEWMEKLNTGNPNVGYNSKDPHFTRPRLETPEITPGVPTPNNLENCD